MTHVTDPEDLRAQAQRCRRVAEQFLLIQRGPINRLAEEFELRAADLEANDPLTRLLIRLQATGELSFPTSKRRPLSGKANNRPSGG